MNVGFVFQEYNLLQDLTILENVTLPPYLKLARNDDLKKAEKLLDIFDIASLGNEKANTVSGGKRKGLRLLGR